MRIVLHSDDLELLDRWKHLIDEEIFEVDELSKLTLLTNSIVIVNYTALENRVDDYIHTLKENDNKILLLHRTPTLEVAKHLMKTGVDGYGNAMMNKEYFHSAINSLKNNMAWLSSELLTSLIKTVEPQHKDKSEILNPLSQREKEVANLLKDGLSYNQIGTQLDITPRTVKAHAQHCYEKLGVKDRLALALLLK